jgi:hypothetical protein
LEGRIECAGMWFYIIKCSVFCHVSLSDWLQCAWTTLSVRGKYRRQWSLVAITMM